MSAIVCGSKRGVVALVGVLVSISCATARESSVGAGVAIAEPISAIQPPSQIVTGRPLSDTAQRAQRLWELRLDPAALQQAMQLWQGLADDAPDDPEPRLALARAHLYAAEGPLFGNHRMQAMIDALTEAARAAADAAALTCRPGPRLATPTTPKGAAPGGVVGLGAAARDCGPAAQEASFLYRAAMTQLAVHGRAQYTLLWHEQMARQWLRDLPSLTLKRRALALAYMGLLAARVPAFAGGDVDLARQHFTAAMAADPTLVQARVWYAEAVAYPAGNTQLTRELLTQVAQKAAGQPPLADFVQPEQQLAIIRAKQLLARASDWP